MKKIYLILIAVLLVGTITAVSLSLSDTDFKTKVTKISSDLFYTKLLTLNKIDSKEIPKDTNLDLENSGLDITKNKEGVIRVRAE